VAFAIEFERVYHQFSSYQIILDYCDSRFSWSHCRGFGDIHSSVLAFAVIHQKLREKEEDDACHVCVVDCSVVFWDFAIYAVAYVNLRLKMNYDKDYIVKSPKSRIK
jgi:hypothetical protein